MVLVLVFFIVGIPKMGRDDAEAEREGWMSG